MKNLTDEKLFNLCKKYGELARTWRQKFAGLLPEVYKRRLYEKKGFSSIFEFAAKLAGMSEDQVRRVLNLEKKFENKPILKSMLENGEVSINKLAKIASIATADNQEILANQVLLLPCRALETLVRDEKNGTEPAVLEDLNGLFAANSMDKSVHVNTKEPRLDDDVKSQLTELQEKGIDINKIIRDALERRELEIAQEKEQISTEIQQTRQPGVMRGKIESAKKKLQSNQVKEPPPKPSRYIPVKIKKLIQKEHGSKCSLQNCHKPAQTIHHTQRFALAHVHDPRYLAPLCKEHHVIAHSIDVRFHERRKS